jgi:hypothetical protein
MTWNPGGCAVGGVLFADNGDKPQGLTVLLRTPATPLLPAQDHPHIPCALRDHGQVADASAARQGPSSPAPVRCWQTGDNLRIGGSSAPPSSPPGLPRGLRRAIGEAMVLPSSR